MEKEIEDEVIINEDGEEIKVVEPGPKGVFTNYKVPVEVPEPKKVIEVATDETLAELGYTKEDEEKLSPEELEKIKTDKVEKVKPPPEDTELSELGYTAEDIKELKPEDIEKIKTEKIKKEVEVEEETFIQISEKTSIPIKKVVELYKKLEFEKGARWNKFDAETKVDLLIDKLNLYAQRRSNDDKSQEISEVRKKLDLEKEKMIEDRKILDEKEKDISAKEIVIKERITEIGEEIKEKDKIAREDADDIADITERIKFVNKQEKAEADKEKLEAEQKKLEKELTEGQEAIKKQQAEAFGITIRQLTAELQMEFPEFVTNESVVDKFYKFISEDRSKENFLRMVGSVYGMPVRVPPWFEKLSQEDKDDLIRGARIGDVISYYNSRPATEKKLSIAEFYKTKLENYPTLPVKTAKKIGAKIIDIKTAKAVDLIKEIQQSSKNEKPAIQGRDTSRSHQKTKEQNLTKDERMDNVRKVFTNFRPGGQNVATG